MVLTDVKGIKCNGMHSGIKKKKKDLAIIASDSLCQAAAVYTKNKVKGAPLYIDMEHLKDGKAQAIIINSGIANVATGQQGLDDAENMTELTAKKLGIKKEDVLVASTGVIGKYLPMDVIEKGIEQITLDSKSSKNTAEAILTTDLSIKEITLKVGNATIAAIAKGSGMIHPNMATMLAFIFTDATIESKKLQEMLKDSVNKSFNMISVDTDTSTSDMVTLMANGLAGKVDYKEFKEKLDTICIELAKMIAKDGEGATKLIEASVTGAKSEQQAKLCAKKIICSPLVKTAFFGNDPNWGRILAAIGNAEIDLDEDKIEIAIADTTIFKAGKPEDFNHNKLKKLMKAKEVKIDIKLNNGNHHATAYGCDLSYDYVKINADYHT